MEQALLPIDDVGTTTLSENDQHLRIRRGLARYEGEVVLKSKWLSNVWAIARSRDLQATVVGKKIEISDFRGSWKGTLRTLKGHKKKVGSLFFSSDGALVTGSEDGTVRRWAPGSGQLLWQTDLGAGEVFSVCELHDARVAVGCRDRTVRLLDGATGAEGLVCRAHAAAVYAVVSLGENHPSGSLFVSGSWDRTIRMWAGDGRMMFGRSFRGEEAGVMSLAVTPDRKVVMAGCMNGWLSLFRFTETDQGAQWTAVSLFRLGEPIRSISVSPNGLFFAIATHRPRRPCKVYGFGPNSLASLRHLAHDYGPFCAVLSVLFTSDSSRVITGCTSGSDCTLWRWRLFPAEEKVIFRLCAGVPREESDSMRELVMRIKRIVFSDLKKEWELDRPEVKSSCTVS